MKIAVYGTEVQKDFLPVYNRLFNFLKENNVELLIAEKIYEILESDYGINPIVSAVFGKNNKLDDTTKLLLSVGGDGTFLDAASQVYGTGIPIAGINCGRLGFLADITSDNFEETLQYFFNGNYTIEQRSILEMVEPKNVFSGFNFAVNDLTVHKLDNSSMIKIRTSIDNEFLANYWADGLIISTPTGSTAYSLSVGGPIVTPGLAGIIITPIASHHLTVRPVVVTDNVEIELELEGRGNQYLVSIDHRSLPLDFTQKIIIRKAKTTIPIIKFEGQSFYATLRNKLMWGADRRNQYF